jgi:DNA-binding Lrp family transcriptional regulator
MCRATPNADVRHTSTTPRGQPLRDHYGSPIELDEREGAVTVSAYILIQTEVGKASSVVAAVRDLPGVVQADDVTGPYDVILRTEADSIDELGRMVVSQVQLVDGITRTLTCPVVHL